MKISVICKCGFAGIVVVEKKDKNKYKCPDCGCKLKKGEGTYIYFGAGAKSGKSV